MLKVTKQEDVPTLELQEIPERTKIFAEVPIWDEAQGCYISQFRKIDVTDLLGDANRSCCSTWIPGNGYDCEIGGGVVPAYLSSTYPHKILEAKPEEGKLAKFLLINKDGTNYEVQGNSIAYVKNHGYIVGRQYYLGKDGMPTTDDTQEILQKLFYVLNEDDLLVNID